jgi:hypothetical protein
MNTIAALSTGTKLLLGAGVLLFVDLFLTWQQVPIDFGRRAEVTQGLDGWDVWGLLIGLLTFGLLVSVAVKETREELPADGRWELATLVVAGLVLAIVVLKNFGDSDSTLQSYVGVVLAGVLTAGAYLEWTRARSEDRPLPTPWWAQASSSQGKLAQGKPAQGRPTERRSAATANPDEPRPRW